MMRPGNMEVTSRLGKSRHSGGEETEHSLQKNDQEGGNEMQVPVNHSFGRFY